MRAGLGITLSLFVVAANARPVVIEQSASFGSPDPAYSTFAADVAIDGDFAVVSAGRSVPDSALVPGGEKYLTAFLFARSGNKWTAVRRLQEYREDPTFPVPPAVAMRDGLAVVQTVQTDFWQFTCGTWVQQKSAVTREAPGPYLATDSGRVINGDGGGEWNARIYQQSGGSWTTAATLLGKRRLDGGDNDFRGGPADISGAWAVVQQPDGDGDPVAETFVYHDYGGTTGWDPIPYGGMRPPAGATRFGDEVAIRWPDVFVGGGNESGTFVFREIPQEGFQLATRLQTVDSFMGAGPAGAFATSDDLVLQHAWSFDRSANVINVFAKGADGGYSHVAQLVAKNGASLGRAISIDGRRVLVGDNGNGLVYYFELPATLTTPARLQDNFASGNGGGWSTSAGSQFATVKAGRSRVFRQSSVAGQARAFRASSDWTAQAIEADVRPLQFAASGGGVGLMTRYQNEQNFFDVLVRSIGVVQLRRMAGGTLRTFASVSFKPVAGRSFRLRLESIGTRHRVLIDGKVILDADKTGPTHGIAALTTDHAQADFDNVILSPALQTTMYTNNFETKAPGPWAFSGLGFWNLWNGASVVYNQSSVAGDARASIGAPTEDQIVRVRARLDTFASATGTQERWFGVMARYVDDQNYYFLSLRSSNFVSLRKVVNGVATTLATVPLGVSPAVWYSLRLDAVGDQLRGYVDGKLLVEATDDTLASGASGPVMFKAAADYDDFLAYQP
ncbi:MAG: hypothetical protein ABI821_08610 [Pseudomonadota bacterium]